MEYCRHKIAESKYFFEKLESLEKEGQLLEFTYNLSAFLSATRSISSYVQDKAKKKKEVQTVIDVIEKDKIIRFLVKQRNYTVHRKQLKLSASANADLYSSITVNPKESIEVETYNINDEGDEIVQLTQVEPEYYNVSYIQKDSSPTISYQFIFDEWKGSEDILYLCGYYLNWLEQFVSEMRNKGYIN
ncbi:hypothetical protein FHP05_00090 [Cerasibacillus terrae]|uniref:Uncharacterized protein n=1 Tax=Cerasibacillus terrae TaxID=2498845 RepID=A0A5C8P1H4_9BACI|nr:hypothetical protein [Cerasibacillus terrae]TXL67460.1 hypothetical protein FHP05_00090 [Cerasibacillus terrae]